ncbi:hypothetical protein FIV42_28795 [Persicimonas caeni]|uniref:Uncharacterized protein n=1 Tax=Persicimonas caeni TaxID=2292766 RepID=A0A4Y6Q2E1_PERCE|nr:hypothetical protein [Persicimonas caeni]QDG54600.1 hypothetical protein FIV42_28795 [Persicimonas caeni]QED35821.1 hypothetical protein FRD00_28790 [Persicimonas caeni]
MTSSKNTTSQGEREVELLAPRQKQLIRQALTARFSAFLKPGESLELDAEQSEDYVYGTIAVTSADESFRLDLEASILAADQKAEKLDSPERFLELALEFLKLQLYEFFRQDRQERFHVDWRLYPVEKATIRFRGQIRKPSLEREADALLGEEDSETPAD